MEMFNLITKEGLTPNQFYLLYSMREGISPFHINLHQELRMLSSNAWISDENKLQPKSLLLVQQIEGFFKVQKKKTNSDLMGEGAGDNIDKYQSLFPRKKLPSGKVARSDKTNVENNFRWFFETHKYSWETILKATAHYVDEYEAKNYLYMRTSAYFIRKTELDKSIISDLADYCAIVESGDDLNQDTHFSDRVV